MWFQEVLHDVLLDCCLDLPKVVPIGSTRVYCDPYGIPLSLFEQLFKGLLKFDIDGHEEFLKAQNQWLGAMTR